MRISDWSSDVCSSDLLKAVNGRVKVKIILEDGSTYDREGNLAFVGASVSTGTGNVTLRAVVPNPDALLLPGTYVRAVLPMAIKIGRASCRERVCQYV